MPCRCSGCGRGRLALELEGAMAKARRGNCLLQGHARLAKVLQAQAGERSRLSQWRTVGGAPENAELRRVVKALGSRENKRRGGRRRGEGGGAAHRMASLS
eukprot:jgi/Mesen1/3885/ME000208S02894